MKNYYNIKEASKYFNIDTSSFRKLLNRHKEIKQKYVSKRRHEGDSRAIQYISKDGMIELANVKNVKRVTMTSLTEGKKMLVEKALAYDKLVQELPSLFESFNKRITALESNETPLIAEKPREITTRGKINQMVRRYSKENLIPHNLVWGKLYTQLYYRYQYNAQIRSKNQGIPPLDCIYNDGQMDNLFKIAFEILS